MRNWNLVLLFALFILIPTANGNDWPHYLGPNDNATSSETGLAKTWPEEGPKVLWTVPLGAGYGAPAVYDGKVYLLDRIGSEQDALRCYDLETGKEEWNFAYDANGRVGHPGSRSVPSVNEKYVYTCGPHGDVYCFDRKTHKPVWNKSLSRDFGPAPRLGWGYGHNPTLYKNMLFVPPMTSEAGAAALDAETGDVLWTSDPLPGRASYASVAIINVGGEDHVVAISALNSPRGRRRGRSRDSNPAENAESAQTPAANQGAIVGLNPNDGKELWRYTGWQCRIPVANLVTIGDGRFFITGGYEAGCAMLRIEKKGQNYTVTELFKNPVFGTHVHPPLLYKDHLYGHCSTNESRNGLVCMSLDGDIQWKTGSDPIFDKGGLMLADGRIYSVDGNEGFLYMIDPSPDGFKPIAKAKLLGGNEIWAPLTLVDGKLLIRDQQQMKCVLVK